MSERRIEWRDVTDLRYEIRQLIARLELVSHVPAVNLDPTPAATDAEKGGMRPRGGIDRKDDREPEFLLKSADHYRRRFAGARSERALALIHADLLVTIRMWERTPPPSGDQPAMDHPQWKKWIAESPRSDADLARLYHVSRQYVGRVRRAYRGPSDAVM